MPPRMSSMRRRAAQPPPSPGEGSEGPAEVPTELMRRHLHETLAAFQEKLPEF